MLMCYAPATWVGIFHLSNLLEHKEWEIAATIVPRATARRKGKGKRKRGGSLSSTLLWPSLLALSAYSASNITMSHSATVWDPNKWLIFVWQWKPISSNSPIVPRTSKMSNSVREEENVYVFMQNGDVIWKEMLSLFILTHFYLSNTHTHTHTHTQSLSCLRSLAPVQFLAHTCARTAHSKTHAIFYFRKYSRGERYIFTYILKV